MRGRKIDGLVETVRARHLQSVQARNVLHHLARTQREREQRSVRCNDKVFGQVPPEPQARHAKGAILIILIRVKRIVARFGNAPRYILVFAVLDLSIHCGQTTAL